jgi:hypothetical protein
MTDELPQTGDASAHARVRVRVGPPKKVYKAALPAAFARCPACDEVLRVDATVRIRRVRA